MKFWNALRWFSSLVFIAIAVAIWLTGHHTGEATNTSVSPLPPAPLTVR
jgi:hypothetical protein